MKPEICLLDCIFVAFDYGYLSEDGKSYLEKEVKAWYDSDCEYRNGL